MMLRILRLIISNDVMYLMFLDVSRLALAKGEKI